MLNKRGEPKMTNYTYKKIQEKAKQIKNNIEKNYKNGADSEWSYYFAKAIVTKKDVKKISIKEAKNQQGEAISRGISKADYTDMAKRYVKYVEGHKNQLPNFLEYKGIKIAPHLLTGFFAKVIANNYPKTQNINRKWYTKPTETGNVVYNNFVKKYGKKYTTMDDLLGFVKSKGKYLFYFDDQKSNQQVINCLCGNCTDWLQWFCNMVSAMGYEFKVVHVKCRVSGTGHVRGQFRHPKHTGGKWVNRDIAAVADGGSITSIWCSDGIVQAYNPSWFMQNLHR